MYSEVDVSWRVGCLENISTLKGHEGPVNSVKFNSDGTYCISCSQDKTLILWNPHTSLFVKQYKGPHNHGISDVTITQDSSKFVSVGGDYAAFLWDVAEGRVVRKFVGHTGKLECCNMSMTNEVLCTGSYDKTVRLWDLKSSNRTPIQILADATDSVSSICITETEILTSSVDGCVRCYDIRQGRLSCDNFISPITSVSLSRDKTCLLLSCMDETIYLTEKLTGEVVAKYKGHSHTKYKINSILTSFDECVISGSENQKLFMWDVLEGSTVNQNKNINFVSSGNSKNMKSINAHKDVVVAVAIHSDQNILLSASADKTIKVWSNRLSVKQ